MPTVAGTAYPIADCVFAGVSPTNDAIRPIASSLSSLRSLLMRFTAMPKTPFSYRLPDEPVRGRCASASGANCLPGVLDHWLALIQGTGALLFPDSTCISFDGRPRAAPERFLGGEVVTEAECRREAVVRGAALGQLLVVEAPEIVLVRLERSCRGDLFDLDVLMPQLFLDRLNLVDHVLSERHFLDHPRGLLHVRDLVHLHHL